jgi:PiT family inorganic phosphate transporter
VITYILLIVFTALVFDFINGFHDSANSIATIVGTRVLSPFAAVAMAAFFNFSALFLFGTAVAKTISAGLIQTDAVTPNVIMAGLLGAITWNLITWYFGIPSSSSHALIGGYAGAAVSKAGFGALLWGKKWITTLSFIVVSPVVGALLGFTIMAAVLWMFHRSSPLKVDRVFRRGQILSSAVFSLSHGANDAQKTMGIIVGLLSAEQVQRYFADPAGPLHFFYIGDNTHIPFWVKLSAHVAIGLGTLFGGWRIVHTMGTRITRLRPVGGFAAETAGACSIFLATGLGIPVSTTHTITGAIVGVGATNRLSAVRWGLARNIVWAWVVTIPASALVAALAYWLLTATAPTG